MDALVSSCRGARFLLGLAAEDARSSNREDLAEILASIAREVDAVQQHAERDTIADRRSGKGRRR